MMRLWNGSELQARENNSEPAPRSVRRAAAARRGAAGLVGLWLAVAAVAATAQTGVTDSGGGGDNTAAATTPSVTSGARSADTKIPLWPLLFYSNDADDHTIEILWPLWTDSEDRATAHRVRSVLWPFTRFSQWRETGDRNHYVFPYFWGSNHPDAKEDPALAPNRYYFLVPVFWRFFMEEGDGLVIPPFYHARYNDGNWRWGIFPLWWRWKTPSGIWTVLVPFWRHSQPPDISTGGLFPLIWYFHLPKSKTYVLVPGWYHRSPNFLTFGLFPLGWHNRTKIEMGEVKTRKTYTNFVILWNSFTSEDGYLHTLFPIIRFSKSKKDQETFRMIFPYFWGSNPVHTYVCFFPFAWSYHKEKKKFDNWSLVPLYWRFRNLDVGRNSGLPIHNLDAIFPIWGRNRGPADNQNWHFVLFPLYVFAKKGEAQARFFLYPFTGISQNPQKRSWWVFPLVYGSTADYRQKQDDKEIVGTSRSILLLLGFLMNYETNPQLFHLEFLRFSILLPPLIVLESRPDYYKARLTALYGFKRDKKSLSWDVLLILLNYKRTENERRFFMVAPFVVGWKKTTTFARFFCLPGIYNRRDFAERPLDQDGPTKRHLNVVFPISYFDRREDGRLKWALLDPLAFLRDDEDVSRHYSALIHLVDFKRRSDTSTEFRLGWRLFHRTVKPDHRSLEMFPFIYASKGQDSRRFSLGWRVFEYDRSGGTGAVRVLFLPIVKWGTVKVQ